MITDRHYPRNFFDPFGGEPTHSQCENCGEWFANEDLTNVRSRWYPFYVCEDCLEVLEIPNEDD